MSECSRGKVLLALSQILAHYEWLMNSYNIDYFLDDHWSKLPTKWAECLNQLKISDIPWLMDSSKPAKYVLPLTILCLRSSFRMVRLIRSARCDPKVTLFSDQANPAERHAFSKKLSTPLDHILTRGIKLKKRHEIEQLCQLISCLMNKFDNQLDIIDFGSGKCHLSRILNLCYGYRVFCIEANQDNIHGASIREDKTLKALEKYKKFDVPSEQRPTKVNCYVTEEERVDQLFGDQLTRPHLLLGLHACGSLSNLVLEKFVENPGSKCLVLACCCYMKSESFRFPMSRFLKENSSTILSVGAKELACHAAEKFLSKFSKEDLDSLKVHGYRACLEYLIEKYAPQRRHQPMKSVRIDSQMTFKEYVDKAINGFEDICIPDDVFRSDLIEHCTQQFDGAVLFYALRLLIAPLIELCILLDYQQFLEEQDPVRQTYLLPLFEPEISPRNLILLAHK